MKTIIFLLLMIGKTMSQDGDYKVDDAWSYWIRKAVILKQNEFFSGTESNEQPVYIDNLKLLKTISKDDGLTVTYGYSKNSWDKDFKWKGSNISFCVDDLYTVDGSVVRMTHSALMLTEWQCPFSSLKSTWSTKRVQLYGLHFPSRDIINADKTYLKVWVNTAKGDAIIHLFGYVKKTGRG